MRWLHEELERYADSEVYPFHMPGGKRQPVGLEDAYRYDITEVDGFDDLRHADGILRELEDGWAAMYGAGRAFVSVNGSTGGNLAAIYAATEQHGAILVAGDCHWSVTNAAALRELTVYRVESERTSEGFGLAVSAERIAEVLAAHPDVQAVVVTSPTYEGVVSDIATISDVVHAHNAKLLVDSAHGAHCGLRVWRESCTADTPDETVPRTVHGQESGDRQRRSVTGANMLHPASHATESPSAITHPRARHWQTNPITQGADVVVVSLHKTLPVMGQVSLVLLPKDAAENAEAGGGATSGNAAPGRTATDSTASDSGTPDTAATAVPTGNASRTSVASLRPETRIAPERVRHYLNMFQTSSPSYVLLASASRGLQLIEQEGTVRLRTLAERLDEFYRRTAALQKLHIVNNDSMELSKIVISTRSAGISGAELAERLRKDFRLEIEKAAANHVIAMTSMMDRAEGFERLADALTAIDAGM